jgi:hypothetical protein
VWRSPCRPWARAAHWCHRRRSLVEAAPFRAGACRVKWHGLLGAHTAWWRSTAPRAAPLMPKDHGGRQMHTLQQPKMCDLTTPTLLQGRAQARIFAARRADWCLRRVSRQGRAPARRQARSSPPKRRRRRRHMPPPSRAAAAAAAAQGQQPLQRRAPPALQARRAALGVQGAHCRERQQHRGVERARLGRRAGTLPLDEPAANIMSLVPRRKQPCARRRQPAAAAAGQGVEGGGLGLWAEPGI